MNKSNHGLAGCFGENGFNFDPSNRDQLADFCNARSLLLEPYKQFIGCANQIWNPQIDKEINKALKERVDIKKHRESNMMSTIDLEAIRDIISHIHADQDQEITIEINSDYKPDGISNQALGKLIAEAASQGQSSSHHHDLKQGDESLKKTIIPIIVVAPESSKQEQPKQHEMANNQELHHDSTSSSSSSPKSHDNNNDHHYHQNQDHDGALHHKSDAGSNPGAAAASAASLGSNQKAAPTTTSPMKRTSGPESPVSSRSPSPGPTSLSPSPSPPTPGPPPTHPGPKQLQVNSEETAARSTGPTVAHQKASVGSTSSGSGISMTAAPALSPAAPRVSPALVATRHPKARIPNPGSPTLPPTGVSAATVGAGATGSSQIPPSKPGSSLSGRAQTITTPPAPRLPPTQATTPSQQVVPPNGAVPGAPASGSAGATTTSSHGPPNPVPRTEPNGSSTAAIDSSLPMASGGSSAAASTSVSPSPSLPIDTTAANSIEAAGAKTSPIGLDEASTSGVAAGSSSGVQSGSMGSAATAINIENGDTPVIGNTGSANAVSSGINNQSPNVTGVSGSSKGELNQAEGPTAAGAVGAGSAVDPTTTSPLPIETPQAPAAATPAIEPTVASTSASENPFIDQTSATRRDLAQGPEASPPASGPAAAAKGVASAAPQPLDGTDAVTTTGAAMTDAGLPGNGPVPDGPLVGSDTAAAADVQAPSTEVDGEVGSSVGAANSEAITPTDDQVMVGDGANVETGTAVGGAAVDNGIQQTLIQEPALGTELNQQMNSEMDDGSGAVGAAGPANEQQGVIESPENAAGIAGEEAVGAASGGEEVDDAAANPAAGVVNGGDAAFADGSVAPSTPAEQGADGTVASAASRVESGLNEPELAPFPAEGAVGVAAAGAVDEPNSEVGTAGVVEQAGAPENLGAGEAVGVGHAPAADAIGSDAGYDTAAPDASGATAAVGASEGVGLGTSVSGAEGLGPVEPTGAGSTGSLDETGGAGALSTGSPDTTGPDTTVTGTAIGDIGEIAASPEPDDSSPVGAETVHSAARSNVGGAAASSATFGFSAPAAGVEESSSSVSSEVVDHKEKAKKTAALFFSLISRSTSRPSTLMMIQETDSDDVQENEHEAKVIVSKATRKNSKVLKPHIHDVIVVGPHVPGDDLLDDYDDHEEHHSQMDELEDDEYHEHSDHHQEGALILQHKGHAPKSNGGSKSMRDLLIEHFKHNHKDHSDHEHLLKGLTPGDVIHVDADEHD